MDLLKYLAPMKNVPERFSNLAFWRGVRKLKDAVVSALEYMDSWGKQIENTEVQMKLDIGNALASANDAKYSPKYSVSNDPWQTTQPRDVISNYIDVGIYSSDNSIVINDNDVSISFTQTLNIPEVPSNKELIIFGAFFYVTVNFGSGSQSFFVPASFNISYNRASNSVTIVILTHSLKMYLTDTPVSAKCRFICDVGFNYTV